jgi:hypothetical protein
VEPPVGYVIVVAWTLLLLLAVAGGDPAAPGTRRFL